MLSAPSPTVKCGCGLNFPKVSGFVHALALIFPDCTGEKFHEIPDILFEERLLRVSSSCKMLYRCASVCVCVCVRTHLAQGLGGMERTYDQTKFLT